MFEPDELMVGGYVLASDYDKQAQEIERLSSMVSKGLDNAYQQRQEIERLTAELEQLKSESFESLYNAAVDDLDAALAELEQVKKALEAIYDCDYQAPHGSTNAEISDSKKLCIYRMRKLAKNALFAAPPSTPTITEADLEKSGLGYPLHKEQAVQLWHKGFRSEPITVLEAWEAIGHDIGCNPSKDELFDSLRNMSEICRTHGFDTPSIPETSVVVERELQKIVTESLMGMISAVTSSTPPPNEPPPPFIQAAIDRAVERIRAILSSKGDV
jgi:hypothetical protein